MKYHCGHYGCDICGAAKCDGANLTHYGDYVICKPCLFLAIRFAVHAAETFGGRVIDPSKTCGNIKRKMEENTGGENDE